MSGCLIGDRREEMATNASNAEASRVRAAAARVELSRKIQEKLPEARMCLARLKKDGLETDVAELAAVVDLMEEAVARLLLRGEWA